MKGDFSRLRFSPRKNYTSVLQQQGRVSLDADANEQCAINEYLRTTETVDVVGVVGGPIHNEGFEISVDDKTNSIQIGKGRYYVDGILCANSRDDVPYAKQPFLMDPNPTDQSLLSDLSSGSISAIQVYLQVWRRLVTALDDPCLLEPAIGRADTTARVQTIWRVVAQPGTSSGTSGPPGKTCCDSIEAGPVPVKDPGKLNAQTGGSAGDCSCQPTPAAGYRGLENQLYRVEIHQPGDETTATFKWSRDNGSVVVAVKSVSGTQVTVDSLGPDANLGIGPQQWVEIYDDTDLFGTTPNQSGSLYQIKSVSPETLTVTMYQTVMPVDPTRNARMRRWDQTGSSATTKGVSVSTTWVDLESGIQVEFGKGKYNSGDYWLIPARTATGSIEWPPCASDGQPLQPAHGTELFQAPLACIRMDGQKYHVQDCRKKFHPLTELTPASACCCTYTVGQAGSLADFTSIQDAIDALPPEGGEVCILPGRYIENVFIVGRRDVVVHGCGWQTRVAYQKAPPPDTTGAVNPISAVFTIAESAHIELRSFVVEASDDEAGILVDGTGTSLSTKKKDDLDLFVARVGRAADVSDRSVVDAHVPSSYLRQQRGAIDITIKDLVITASALPGILAERVQLLRIDGNRVAMKNVRSLWPAIYASGDEIHIDHNWVGILSATSVREWVPYAVYEDLSGSESKAAGGLSSVSVSRLPDAPAGFEINQGIKVEMNSAALQFIDSTGLKVTQVEIPSHPGGIQIGGPSTDVYVVENEIEGGSRNGVTLGSFDVLDAKEKTTGVWTGALITAESDCGDTGTLGVSGSYPGQKGYTVVAGGILTNVQIHRNRIRNVGFCGIGPVGFFNLAETLEIISIVGLDISGNGISRTLLRNLAPRSSANALDGYGAICVPDVRNLTVRDNTITDFGAEPGAEVCGIYVVHGERIEISGNQVIETRDWTKAVKGPKTPALPLRGGIFVALGTPPSFPQALDSTLWVSTEESRTGENSLRLVPTYEPALPAVRVEGNVVRVPLCYALAVAGWGPFTIVNNHLGCGGLVRSTETSLAQTALVFNFGSSLEGESLAMLASGVYKKAFGSGTPSAIFKNVSCGAVLFSNNMCHLEATVSRQNEDASVFIFTPDHLIFNNNHCWLDTYHRSALYDTILLAGSLNVVGNRFQEAVLSVAFFLSALTVGLVNVTGQNISTYCILALGTLNSPNNNLALVQLLYKELCADLHKAFTPTA